METIKILGTDVFQLDDSEWSEKFGFFIAQDIPQILAASFIYLGNEYKKNAIVVNGKFTSCPREEKEALVAHELGHIQAGHLKNAPPGILTSLENELKADDYAVSQGHRKGLKAWLEKHYKTAKEVLWYLSDDEEVFTDLQKRLARLQGPRTEKECK